MIVDSHSIGKHGRRLSISPSPFDRLNARQNQNAARPSTLLVTNSKQFLACTQIAYAECCATTRYTGNTGPKHNSDRPLCDKLCWAFDLPFYFPLEHPITRGDDHLFLARWPLKFIQAAASACVAKLHGRAEAISKFIRLFMRYPRGR